MEEQLTEAEKIQIILHEYDALRTEIRDTISFQRHLLVTIFSLVLGAFGFAFQKNITIIYLIIPVLLLIFLIYI